ncbi:MAG: hypothetical protein RMK99_12735, partial [Anaerolineales bacterium]|nr:hypothetical protein [Anaerolineales bacterium]
MLAHVLRVVAVAILWLSRLVAGLTLALLLAGDSLRAPTDLPGKVRTYTRGLEFDFVGWTLNALGVKLQQASINDQLFLSEAERGRYVREFFELRARLNRLEDDIAARYADPTIADPDAATANLRAQQAALRSQLAERQPLVEAILQEQVAAVFAEQGLDLGGQVLPPPLFHFTPLPLALIISPRDEIRQVAIEMINGDLTLDQQVELEERAARGLNVSTLVTPVGGIGTYPTMVRQSADLNWIVNVIAHEWAHNYFTLRPLGALYDATPELRIMNETAATIIGDEVGPLVMRRYYPDLAPPLPPFRNFIDRTLAPEEQPAPPTFDFRAEMRATRVRTDELLAQGRIEEAEAYMEERRRVFWKNGYRIRKLNQAYFAFHGAYNAEPGGGASGADPVGPAVRLLRRRSASLAEFMTTIAWFSSV